MPHLGEEANDVWPMHDFKSEWIDKKTKERKVEYLQLTWEMKSFFYETNIDDLIRPAQEKQSLSLVLAAQDIKQENILTNPKMPGCSKAGYFVSSGKPYRNAFRWVTIFDEGTKMTKCGAGGEGDSLETVIFDDKYTSRLYKEKLNKAMREGRPGYGTLQPCR